MAGSAIHIGIPYEDALESRKNLLKTEENLIKLLHIIKRYRALKSEEFRLKLRLKKDLSSLKIKLRSFKKTLPIRESREKLEKIKKHYAVELEKELDKDLELQLEKIREKLRGIQ